MEMEKYLPELLAEKDTLDPSFQHSLRLLDQEIEKVQRDEDKDEEKFIDVVINKNMKLGQKVLIPVKQFPKDYNDEIRQAQLQELTYLNGGSEDAKVPSVRGKSSTRGRGTPVPGPPRSRGGVPPLHGAVPRGAAPRGALPSRAPSSRGRGVQRARGAPPAAGYRPAPPVVLETYGEYDYDDGYGTAYDDQGYESYDNSYNNQGQGSEDYYEYGHSGETYGQEEWANNRGKAQSARTNKGVYREQPYSRY
uniref:KH RNA binding domain containing, signal transduction associated 3 n=1 Tax=Nothobranchius furzeri TaxID=105023 RepID=A0A8C6MDH5_NOTFU